MKKMIRLLTAFLLICLMGAHGFAAAPELASQSACVMDADTGQILYEKDADTKRAPASITKIMSALVALENCSLNRKIVASEESLASVDPASTRIGFVPGEKTTVRELMRCMLVYSANDAANLLAQAVSGDVDSFVEKMNEKAAELGCTNTHFVNPSGLDDDGHETTAHDMALIAYAANQYPELQQFAGMVSFMLQTDNIVTKEDRWTVYTKVDMLVPSNPYYNPDITAGKTGWTHHAQHTFVAYATHNKQNLILVVMDSPLKGDKYTDTEKLIDYCVSSMPSTTIPVDRYEERAQDAAHAASTPVSIVSSSLSPLSLRLPTGITANDLVFAVTQEDNQDVLRVLISPEKTKAYTAATGMHASEPLASLPVQVEPYTLPSLTGMLKSGVSGLSSSTQVGLWVMVITAGFFVVILGIAFLIGLYRHSNFSRKRRRAKREKRLTASHRRK